VAELVTAEGRRLAVERIPGSGPGIVFLGGFRSDMTGTKALALEAWARGEGVAFTRFDYSGHGRSSGRFEDGAIGDWAADARAVIASCEGPQVLVGSSMGGWIALMLARDWPEKVAGLVTIAAAPDFTRDMEQDFSEADRARMAREGFTVLPSDYSPDGYVITRRLIEDGRRQPVLSVPLCLPMPVRMLQGTADTDVPVAKAMALLDHAQGADIRLTLVKDADHRFSTPECLRLIERAVSEVREKADA
jgi:pimeloyl-ACP methyl ester carboxylesterase